MALNLGGGTRRAAQTNAHGGVVPQLSSDNKTQLGTRGSREDRKRDTERARQTQRKRDRQVRRREVVVPRSPSLTTPSFRQSRLTDGMSFSRGNETSSLSTNGLGADQVSRSSLRYDRKAATGHIDDDSHDDDGRDDEPGDEFTDLFGPKSPPLRSSEQYDDTNSAPYSLHQHSHRPVQPATTSEPIRMFNSGAPHDPGIDGMTVGSTLDTPPRPQTNRPVAKKHPVNTYKGSDPIKKRVQNKRLQRILLDKPMPKPRKHPDRMVLKCTGKQEFR